MLDVPSKTSTTSQIPLKGIAAGRIESLRCYPDTSMSLGTGHSGTQLGGELNHQRCKLAHTCRTPRPVDRHFETFVERCLPSQTWQDHGSQKRSSDPASCGRLSPQARPSLYIRIRLELRRGWNNSHRQKIHAWVFETVRNSL